MLIEITKSRLQYLSSLKYDDYLETEEWRKIRELVLDANGRRCRLCNYDKNLHVHHRYYCQRGTETLDTLTVLCKPCHEMFHKHGKLYSPTKIYLRGKGVPRKPSSSRLERDGYTPKQEIEILQEKISSTSYNSIAAKMRGDCGYCGKKGPCKNNTKGAIPACDACYSEYTKSKASKKRGTIYFIPLTCARE